MFTDMKNINGAFSWVELMTSDLAAAKSFYSQLFGWRIEASDNAEMPYMSASIDGKQIAGIMPIPERADNAPSCWGGYVTVNNVDETLEKAQALGGEVLVPPTDIPNVGRIGVIQDPQGAFISMITYC